jgi:hypothetical protein
MWPYAYPCTNLYFPISHLQFLSKYYMIVK